MSILRSLATFVFSFIFVSTVILAISSYNIGSLVQKESIKDFINLKLGPEIINQECQNQCNQSSDIINQQCEDKCAQYAEKDTCMQLCTSELSKGLASNNCVELCISRLNSQVKDGVEKAIEEVYQKKVFNINLDQISNLLLNYVLFAVIGILCGIVLLLVSPTPFLTTGKNFISISISLFISSIIPQFVMTSVNLPLNLGEAFSDYLLKGFNQQLNYGIAFVVSGIILIIFDYILSRRKNKTENKKSKKK